MENDGKSCTSTSIVGFQCAAASEAAKLADATPSRYTRKLWSLAHLPSSLIDVNSRPFKKLSVANPALAECGVNAGKARDLQTQLNFLWYSASVEPAESSRPDGVDRVSIRIRRRDIG